MQWKTLLVGDGKDRMRFSLIISNALAVRLSHLPRQSFGEQVEVQYLRLRRRLMGRGAVVEALCCALTRL